MSLIRVRTVEGVGEGAEGRSSLLNPLSSVWLLRCSFWISFPSKVDRRTPSRGSYPSFQVSSAGPLVGWGQPGEGQPSGQGEAGCEARHSGQGRPGKLPVSQSPGGWESLMLKAHCPHRGLSCHPRAISGPGSCNVPGVSQALGLWVLFTKSTEIEFSHERIKHCRPHSCHWLPWSSRRTLHGAPFPV